MGCIRRFFSSQPQNPDDNPAKLKNEEVKDDFVQPIHPLPNPVDYDFRPRPLPNHYLNCYLNSVLQSLLVTKEFLACLFDEDHYLLSGQLVNCVQVLAQKRSNDSLRYVIGQIGSKVMENFGRMQCPHVFFLNLISGLSDEIKVRPELEQVENVQLQPLNALFGVTIQYVTSCDECDYTDTSLGQYISLSLPLPSSEDLHILDCVSLLQYPKPLEMACPNCNCIDMRHTSIIQELGNVLVIHFQRYNNGIKDNRLVSFTDTIFINVNDRDEIYEVYAIVYHRGSLYGGHCTAAVQYKGKWIYTNDSQISDIRGGQFECRDAFMLFCRRQTRQDQDVAKPQ